jgi:putative redox protein
VQLDIRSGGLTLRGYLVRPDLEPDQSCGLLVVCHGFPAGPKGAAGAGHTYPQLADRLTAEAGWAVLTFNFRGTGESEGDFSLGGWMDDLRAVVDHALGLAHIRGVWLAGFSTGGSLALCGAGEDERVRGVAALAAPSDFSHWAAAPDRLLAEAGDLGVVRSAGFPDDPDAWARELDELRPLALVGKVPPRPLLIVHGGDDTVVPLVEARALDDAADGRGELRVLSGAGHRLRHDPRAIAVLLGWLERQGEGA